MKVEFEYRRLDKRAGGWGFGLEMAVRVVIRDEKDSLLLKASDWFMVGDTTRIRDEWPRSYKDSELSAEFDPTIGGYYDACYFRGDGRWIVKPPRVRELELDTWPGCTLYFRTEADREKAIQCGEKLALAAAEALQKWISERPAVPGDTEVHRKVFSIIVEEETEPAVNGLRVIRR